MKYLILTLALSGSLFAQRNTPFQAEVRGSGNSGKCTIEVDVDGVVDISVRGTRGNMRTVSGQPGRWVRFQCNAPFPTDGMGEFKFRGIDGRGRQTLVQDPRNNRGAAVIRIEDPKGGSEGYTFDLEWRDGYGYGNDTGGFYPNNSGIGNSGNIGNISDAVRRCEDRVRTQAERQYSLYNISFNSQTNRNPQRGANDYVNGTFEGYRNNYREVYDYSCRVNLNNGNVREVQINPTSGLNNSSSGGFFGNNTAGVWDQSQAVSGCRQAVQNRLSSDGYYDAYFQSINMDNRQGRNDWVTGTVGARRNSITEVFQFDCQVNFQNGSVRNVNVSRR